MGLLTSDTRVRALAINGNGDIFAGTVGDGILRSAHNGDNWNQIKTGLTRPDVRALAINSSGEIFGATAPSAESCRNCRHS